MVLRCTKLIVLRGDMVQFIGTKKLKIHIIVDHSK